MANAGEEEAEEEEDERRGRDKAAADAEKAASVTSKKRASESEVTVNKELMKQLEDAVYNRLIAFLKTASTPGNNLAHR